MKKYLVACLLVLLTTSMTLFAADASSVLQPYVAQYELLRAGQPAGEVKVTLERIGKRKWRMTSHTRGTRGLAALAGIEVLETSEFSATAAGLSCGRYHYRQTGLRKRERSIDCNAKGNEIISRDHRGEYHFPKQAGVLDRQIVSLALALKLAASRPAELVLNVVDRERLEPQRYQVRGEDVLDLPTGSMRTVKLERAHQSRDRITTTWLAADQGWVPARIMQTGTEGGFELRLVALQR